MNPSAREWIGGLFLLACWAAPPAVGSVIFVDASSAGNQDGSTWADAYMDLQQALGAAQLGDEIWVAAGVYTPGPPGDAVSSFVLRSGVALYGGFIGSETAREQRDWVAHPTTLSGDVGHDDVYGSPVWYQGWNINTANSGHVVVGSAVDATAILDGFLITAGSTGPTGTGAGDPLMYGSGLYVIGGTPTVRNCTFFRNLAAFAAGGGIYCQDAAPAIRYCDFIENWVHLGNGAGIAVVGNAVPTIADCFFSGNRAIASSGNTGQGSGISINSLTAPLSAAIERCRFEYNIAQTFSPAGGVEIARGGGISNFGATLTVRDCIFRNNSANAGAGIQTWDPATIINCLFYANVVYSHDFGSGSDGGYGAGICIYSFQPDVATLINCTVANNTGGEGVGLMSLASASLDVRNSIVWGNVANGQDVSPIDAQLKGSSSTQWSCIQDLLTPIPGEDPPDPANFPGCIVVDPLFASAGTDFRLAAGSPCIDAGRNDDVPAGVTTDLEQLPRFQDDPSVADTGFGTPPIVDMGAYEFFSFAVADVNCDGALDALDVQTLTDVLLGLDTAPCHVKAADLNGDETADGADLSSFLAAYLGP